MWGAQNKQDITCPNMETTRSETEAPFFYELLYNTRHKRLAIYTTVQENVLKECKYMGNTDVYNI